jgi:sugar phosphate isomerase/epimerase
MRFAISNIAWDIAEQNSVFQLLSSYAVAGIEVAPTKIWPEWQGASEPAARQVRADLAAKGFMIPSLQAILFGKPDLRVFGSAESGQALLDHLGTVAALARGLGAKVLVFGSPKNRDRGALSPAEAFIRAVPFFREAGSICATAGVTLCIEPNPEGYGCNFVTRWREAADLVEAVAHPGFGLHLDTGCIHMGGDDPVEAISACAAVMCHLHVSEPQLLGFSAPVVDHGRVADALVRHGYGGWISLEMRREEPALEAVTVAVRYALHTYLGLADQIS